MVYPREKKNWGQLGRTVVRKKWREWQLEYEMKLEGVMNKKYLQASILKQVGGYVRSWLEIGSNGLTNEPVKERSTLWLYYFKETDDKPQTFQMKTPMLSFPLAHGINGLLFDLLQAHFLQASS